MPNLCRWAACVCDGGSVAVGFGQRFDGYAAGWLRVGVEGYKDVAANAARYPPSILRATKIKRLTPPDLSHGWLRKTENGVAKSGASAMCGASDGVVWAT